MSDYDEFERPRYDDDDTRCDWCGHQTGERIYYYEDHEPALCCEDPACVEKAEASDWEGMQFWKVW